MRKRAYAARHGESLICGDGAIPALQPALLMTLLLEPWCLLIIAVPVLLLGERVQRRFAWLSRFSVPPPVVGGLGVSLCILVLGLAGVMQLRFQTKVDWEFWNWIVTPGVGWGAGGSKNLTLPLLVGFFTCVGLNATWRLVKGGSAGLVIFWVLATLLAVFQNVLGVLMAKALGESPLLGVICGSLTLTGGHGTALGFSQTLVQAGFPAAATVGAAAATFGVVCGSLIGGPVATKLIRRHELKPAEGTKGRFATLESDGADAGWLDLIRLLARTSRATVFHLLCLLLIIKLGAGLSDILQKAGLLFPAYMGALLVGLLVRNALDLAGLPWIDSRIVDLIGAVLLAIFLTITMASLNLAELAGTAVPMLAILVAQIAAVALFARWVVFRAMGSDYEAAIMSAGFCGFSLGATSNAVANMDSLAKRFGPAPRAFLIVPTVGGLLVDLTNSFNITWFLNLLA